MKFLRWILFVILALAILAVACRLALPQAALRLIRSDPLVPADVVVVLGSYRIERTLEAGTLFREGWSPRILLLRSPDAASSGVLRRLQVKVPLWIDIQKSALAQMAVPAAAISDPPQVLGSTREEAEFAMRWCGEHGYKRIMVVTSLYHTGRARRLFRKAAGRSFEVMIRPDRYESTDPYHWWRRPLDRSDIVWEYLKTLYSLAAPLSSGE